MRAVAQTGWWAHAAAALLLILCSAASAAGAPAASRGGLHRTLQLSPDSSPSGLADPAAPWPAPASVGDGSLTARAAWGNGSLAAAATRRTAASLYGWQPHVETVGGGHDSTSTMPQGHSGGTASLELPISFPEGWLARQASELLAFSLQALRQQEAADDQVL